MGSGQLTEVLLKWSGIGIALFLAFFVGGSRTHIDGEGYTEIDDRRAARRARQRRRRRERDDGEGAESEGDGERGEAPRVDALECDASDAGAKANANAADERKHTRYAEQGSGGRHANFHD